MSQDPWKKAYRMSRAAKAGAQRSAAGRGPRRPRESSVPVVMVFLVLIPFLAGVGMVWYAWQNRGSLIPQHAQELPAAVTEHVTIPPRNADLSMLDGGLGIGLKIFGSQGAVVRSTSLRDLDWSLTALGSERSRLETSGVVMQAQGDVIESYELDVKAVYADKRWEDWLYQLRAANIDPELNLREVRGDAELRPGREVIQLTGPDVVQYGGNWRHPAYELEFQDGWLTKLRGGMQIGAASEPGSSPPPAG